MYDSEIDYWSEDLENLIKIFNEIVGDLLGYFLESLAGII